MGGASSGEDKDLEPMEGEGPIASSGGGDGGTDMFAGVGEFSSPSLHPSHPPSPPSQPPPQLKDLKMEQVKETALR